jgi:hypothetical protein
MVKTVWHCIPSTIFLAMFALVAQGVPQQAREIGMDDDSDWWSIIRQPDEQTLKPQEKDTAASNFRILGITIGRDDQAAIQRKLGRTTVINRGDAGVGRSQICYVSEDGKTHLTFEEGEVEYAFYLFSGGAAWKGSDLCVKSKLVKRYIRTVSGLGLGQSPVQVRAILGRPTTSRQNGELVYFRQIRKRFTESDLKRLRQFHPDLSDRELHESYDFYDFTAHIVAKFASSKLVYLGVLESETI